MKVLGGDQLSSEWFQQHCGCVSGSHAAAVLDFSKERILKNKEKRGGLPGKKRQTYLRMKLAELLTGEVVSDNYVSREMLDGIEREPAARAAYELEENVMVEEVGFALHDTIERLGGSVDGLVGDDGMVEIKCPKAGTHLEWILDGCMPLQHIPQVNSYLSVTGRAWCDFVSYCPMIRVKELRLMIVRWERDPAAIAMFEDRVMQFNAEIDERIERLRAIVGPFNLPAAEAAKFSRYQELTPEMEASLGIDDDLIRMVDPSWNPEQAEGDSFAGGDNF